MPLPQPEWLTPEGDTDLNHPALAKHLDAIAASTVSDDDLRVLIYVLFNRYFDGLRKWPGAELGARRAAHEEIMLAITTRRHPELYRR